MVLRLVTEMTIWTTVLLNIEISKVYMVYAHHNTLYGTHSLCCFGSKAQDFYGNAQITENVSKLDLGYLWHKIKMASEKLTTKFAHANAMARIRKSIDRLVVIFSVVPNL